MKRSLVLTIAIAILGFAAVRPLAAAPCESLAKIGLPNTTVTSATAITPPFSLGSASVSVPFCRVVGFLTPTSDSHIGFEVWLPSADAWNHKFEGVGNGGFAGFLNYSAMVPSLKRGYATMTTDEGHLNNPANPVEDVTWALGHPDKAIDYGYRAEHLTTLTAQKMVETYYGSKASHSYYAGCSAGGVQGIVETTRFPTDYDGYIIGDGTPDHYGLEIAAFWSVLAVSLADPPNAIPVKQLPLIHAAVLKQCAGKDGGLSSDPFLTNPQVCQFDPKVLLCKGGDDPSTCLTAGQVAGLKKVYSGPHTPGGERLYPGFSPGSEMTWNTTFVGKTNPAGVERPWAGFMADIAFEDPAYLSAEKYLKFNFGSDYTEVKKKMIGTETLDSVFGNHGRNLDPINTESGKIIQYHGWDDASIPAMDGVEYYDEVEADQAQRHHLDRDAAAHETQKFYRLFMAPGMNHCSGGAGATNFGQVGNTPVQIDPQHDTLSALEQWVEHGVAPDMFIGSKVDKSGTVSMTRPICVYPQIPVYKGSGNTDDAKNFTCSTRKP